MAHRKYKIRDIKIEGDTAYVVLTKGFFAKIDVDDIDKVNKFNWNSNLIKGIPYASRTKNENGKKINILMHKEIMGHFDGMIIDHVNGDTLDNRKSNLRFATYSQNNSNVKIRKDNKTGFVGVHLGKSGRYIAIITANKKQIHIGMFDSIYDAVIARNNYAKIVHGEFYRDNIDYKKLESIK